MFSDIFDGEGGSIVYIAFVDIRLIKLHQHDISYTYSISFKYSYPLTAAKSTSGIVNSRAVQSFSKLKLPGCVK